MFLFLNTPVSLFVFSCLPLKKIKQLNNEIKKTDCIRIKAIIQLPDPWRDVGNPYIVYGISVIKLILQSPAGWQTIHCQNKEEGYWYGQIPTYNYILFIFSTHQQLPAQSVQGIHSFTLIHLHSTITQDEHTLVQWQSCHHLVTLSGAWCPTMCDIPDIPEHNDLIRWYSLSGLLAWHAFL